MMLVDPPSAFDSVQEWVEFLDEMTAALARGEDVQSYVEMANETVEMKAAGLLSSVD